MKKVLSIFLAATFLLLTMCACTGKEEPQVKDFATIKSEIKNKVDLSSLYEVANVDELCLVYGIDAADVSDYMAYYSLTGVDSEEITVIEAVDSDAADRIKSALEVRYNSKLNEAASYDASQHELIKKCSVEVDGNIVSMIIRDDAADIMSIYK